MLSQHQLRHHTTLHCELHFISTLGWKSERPVLPLLRHARADEAFAVLLREQHLVDGVEAGAGARHEPRPVLRHARLVDLPYLSVASRRRRGLHDERIDLPVSSRPLRRNRHRGRIPGANLLAGLVHVAGFRSLRKEEIDRRRLLLVSAREDRKRKISGERAHGYGVHRVCSGHKATILHGQRLFKPRRLRPPVRRLLRVHAETVCGVGADPERVDDAARGHAGTGLRRAESLEVRAFADERRAVRRVVDALRTVEARALAHHGIHLLAQEGQVVRVRRREVAGLCDCGHVEDVVEPMPRRRCLQEGVLQAQPKPPCPASVDAQFRLGERFVPESGNVLRLVEMSCGEKPLHPVQLVEGERFSAPVRHEDSDREVPARDAALQLVFRHRAQLHQLLVGESHGRRGIVLSPCRFVAVGEVGVRPRVRLAVQPRVRDERHECAVLPRMADRDARLVDVFAVGREGIRAAAGHVLPRTHDDAPLRVPVRSVVESDGEAGRVRSGERLANCDHVAALRHERFDHARNVAKHVRDDRLCRERIERLGPAVGIFERLAVDCEREPVAAVPVKIVEEPPPGDEDAGRETAAFRPLRGDRHAAQMVRRHAEAPVGEHRGHVCPRHLAARAAHGRAVRKRRRDDRNRSQCQFFVE